jgi:lipopolysaccharide/colanic/teichoic acid biosynthesis glycosyltransferase
MIKCDMTRIFDLVLSLTALLILLPFIFFLLILLRITGEGKILFFQERIGKNGEEFKVIKFVTMLENSPNIGAGSITEINDPRVLPLGKILRKTKINEIPQLLNVIKGDMSLIGPRPHVKRDLDGVNQEVLKDVLSVRPGLSGVASIVFRDEENIIHNAENGRAFYDEHIAPYKAELELWFVKQNKNLIYFPLIFFTILQVLNLQPLNIFNFFSLPAIPSKLKKFL